MSHRHASDRRAAVPPRSARDARTGDVICGINAVYEALRVGRRPLSKLWVAEGKARQRMRDLMALAAERGTMVESWPASRLTVAAGTPGHQGVVAFAAAPPLSRLEALVTVPPGQSVRPPLVVLDGVEDPRNLGAIIRSAAAFGIGGVILPERRAAGLTATVAKAAAGGLEHLGLAEVTNIGQSLERLKRRGYWVIGADEQGEMSCDSFSFPIPLALVLGAEGAGLSALVKRHCDVLVKIPVRGALRSLNVAVAAAIFFYEMMRQGQISQAAEPAKSPPP